MSRRSPILTIIIVALVAAACGDSSDTQKFDFDEQPTAVVVETVNGDVTVTRSSGSGSTVEATVRYSGTKPTVALVEIDANGRLVIGDNCSQDCSVDYEIEVGDAADVTIDVGTGDITVNDLDGSFTIKTGTGDVNIVSLVGPISVEVGEGDILGARLTAATASFTAEKGAIDVTFDNIIDDLLVDSRDGDVTTQLPGGPYQVDATSATGDVDVKVDTDEGSSKIIRISSGNGDVTVYEK